MTAYVPGRFRGDCSFGSWLYGDRERDAKPYGRRVRPAGVGRKGEGTAASVSTAPACDDLERDCAERYDRQALARAGGLRRGSCA